MKVRRVNIENDWTFGRGTANYADTSESVAQRVKARLQSFVNDWFLDLEHGLKWFANMDRPADLDAMERDIKTCILNTKGVSKITAFEMIEKENRQLQVIVYVVDTYDKETIIEV